MWLVTKQLFDSAQTSQVCPQVLITLVMQPARCELADLSECESNYRLRWTEAVMTSRKVPLSRSNAVVNFMALAGPINQMNARYPPRHTTANIC